MTQVDFYVLQANDLAARHAFAARLAEKAFRQNMPVLVWAQDLVQAQALDELFWQFRPEAFLPHQLAGTGGDSPVVISPGEDEPSHSGLLINLKGEVPVMFERFQRLAEIVVQTPEILASTRKNFRQYQSQGCPVKTHKLSG